VGSGWCWMPGNFSTWSPGMVTWYEGQGWIGWAPRIYGGGSNPQGGCVRGQNCSTTVSLNTFQSGRPISPNDVVRVNPFRGRTVSSPTVPLTRNLRLPGPAVSGSPLISTTEAAGGSGAHIHRNVAAPTRVFAGSTIRGAWDVPPHAPAAFDQQTRRLVNRSGPALQPLQGNTLNPERQLHGAVTTSTSSAVAVDHSTVVVRTPSGRSTDSFRGGPATNNDALLPARTGLGRLASQPGNNSASLTSIPISNLGARGGAMHHSTSLVPSARPSVSAGGVPIFQGPRMPDFRQNRFSMRNRSMENALSRRQMEMNRRANRQQSVQRAPASRPSSGGFGGGQRMGQSHESMGGGMRGGSSGGMGGGMGGGMRGGAGGGMQGGGARSQGPHR